MLSGGIDIMVEVPADNIATFSSDPSFKFFEQAGPHLWFLILNAKEGPMSDVRVRRAVNYAINKKTLVDNVLQGLLKLHLDQHLLRFHGRITISLNLTHMTLKKLVN